jgi:hypothetical protein
MIENGHVKIGGQDMTSDLQRLQQTYEKNKLASIGETFGKQLGWNLKKEDAVKLGQIVSNTRSTQDLSKALTEFALANLFELVNKFQHTSKDSTAREESSSERSNISGGPGFGVGANGPNVSLFGIQFSADDIKTIRNGNVDEIARMLEAKKSQARTDREAQMFEQALSYTRMAQTASEKSTTRSDALTKAFTKAKEESKQLSFSDKESATFAQEIAQKYGLELTPQALEKLVVAVQSGDTKQIMSVLGDIASKSELRTGKDAEALLNEKKEVGQSAGNLKKEVRNETDPVEKNARKDEKELNKDEKKVSGKLNEANGLGDVNPVKVPQPTPPPNEMPKKPEKPEEVKQQSPSQAPKHEQDPEIRRIVDGIRKEIGQPSTPIKRTAYSSRDN